MTASIDPIYGLVRECQILRAEADYVIAVEDILEVDNGGGNEALSKFDEKLIELCSCVSADHCALFHRRTYLLPFLAGYLEGCNELTAAVLDSLLSDGLPGRLASKGGAI